MAPWTCGMKQSANLDLEYMGFVTMCHCFAKVMNLSRTCAIGMETAYQSLLFPLADSLKLIFHGHHMHHVVLS